MPLVSPRDVRSHLPGDAMAGYLAGWGDTSAQDRELSRRVRAAEASLSRRLQMQFSPVVLKALPDPTLVLGTDYDEEDAPYDFFPQQWANWGWLMLRRRPIVSVERVRLTFGPQMTLGEIPAEWVRPNYKAGSINIVPTPGANYSSIILQTGGWLMPFMSSLGSHQMVPATLSVDYTAGIQDGATDPHWADLVDGIAREAARLALIDLALVKNPGVASVSLSGDGLSESRQLTKFADQIDRLGQQVEAMVQQYMGSETPILMVSV